MEKFGYTTSYLLKKLFFSGRIVDDAGFENALSIILSDVQTGMGIKNFEEALRKFNSGNVSPAPMKSVFDFERGKVEFIDGVGIKFYSVDKWKKKFSKKEIKNRPFIISVMAGGSEDGLPQVEIENKVVAFVNGQHIVCDIPERYYIGLDGKVRFEKNEKSVFLLPGREKGSKAEEDFLNADILHRSSAKRSATTLLKNAGWEDDFTEALQKVDDSYIKTNIETEHVTKWESGIQLVATLKKDEKYKLVSWQCELLRAKDSSEVKYDSLQLASIKYNSKKRLLEMEGTNPATGIHTYKSYERLKKGDVLYTKREKSKKLEDLSK